MSGRLYQVKPARIALLIILLVAGFLRFYGQDWDEGHYLHPDERFIAQVSGERVHFPPLSELDSLFDPANSPINPRRDDANGNPLSFAYGSLPIYVQGIVSWAIDPLFDANMGDYGELYRVGRTLTALLDLTTVVLVYLLGRRIFSEGAGLIGAALYAFAVLPIQLSHFFTVDPWLTTFVTAALYLSIRYVDRRSAGSAALLGVFVGCAFATKASVPALLLPLALAFGYVFWNSTVRPRIVLHALLGAAVALAVFTLFEPYALVRHDPFFEDIRVQSRIVRGAWDVPFTRQFVGLTPGIYELENLFRYSVGPGLLIAGLAGLAVAIHWLLRRRDVALAIPLAWVAAYVPTLLITEARFLRYALPLIPIMALLAGGLLWSALRIPRWRRAAQVVAASALGITALWGVGFVTIYSATHPRIAASEWIYANVPDGAILTAESWDDALPLRLEGQTKTYRIESLDIYGDRPPEEKVEELYEALSNADYVVMSSDRLIYSVDNLPWRYAVQNEFYRRLLDGQLGFQLVYKAELRPGLFGVRYDDSKADESFSVYDHPRVHIFQRVETLSQAEFRERLLWGINQPWEPTRYPSREWLMLDRPVGERDAVEDIGWNNAATGSGIVAVVAWLLVLELFGLAALPWSAAIFRRSPDRGALAARLIGILAVGWLVWIGASLGFWTATAPVAAIFLGLIGIAAWIWHRWRESRCDAPPLPSLRAYAASFGLMASVFGLFLLFRALYPDFWQTYLGGEKPFELAYLRAVAASPEMPPYDPWYSDGAINYYYYGWHLVATVGRIPGVGITHAFQLAVPTFAALLAMQVALIGLLLSRAGPVWRHRKRQLASAGATVLAVVFLGNIDAVRQLIEQGGATADQFDFWRSTRVIDYTINEFPYFSFLWADVHPHVMNLPVVALVLALLVAAAGRLDRSRAGEPLRWGELGMMAAAGVLALGSVFVINAWDMPLSIAMTVAGLAYAGLLRSVRLAATLGAVGAALAGLSYLIFMPIHARFYSVVEGIDRAEAGSELGQFLTFWGIFFVIILAAIGFRAVRDARRPAALWDALPVALLYLLAVLAGTIWALRGDDELATGPLLAATLIGLFAIGGAAVAGRPMRFHPLPFVTALVLIVLAGVLAPSEPSAAVAVNLAAAASILAVTHWSTPRRFLPWAFIAVGCMTIASVEFVYVVDDLQEGPWQRMNTVFKFYLQAWTLVATGAAILLARLLGSVSLPRSPAASGALGVVAGRVSEQRAETGARSRTARARIPGLAFAGIASLALLAGLVYPLMATPVRLRQDMPSTPSGLTLDGYAWMRGGSIQNADGQVIDFTGDLEAIEWLDRNASPTDVIVEAGIGPYRGNGARISSGTGMPAVIGWDRHQYQQRYPEGIAQRMEDVRVIYNSTDPRKKLELLRRYRVRYVIVGDVERYWNTPDQPRPYASEAGLETFEAMLGESLRLAFVSGGTRVYEVLDFPRLPPAPGAVHNL